MRDILLVIICYGVSNIFLKLARQRLDAFATTFWDFIGFAVVVVVITLWKQDKLFSVDRGGALFAVVAGCLFMVGGYFMISAIGANKVGIVLPLVALNIVVSMFLGYLFLEELLTPVQIGAALTMVASACILGMSVK